MGELISTVLQNGSSVSKYYILAPLGEGGMGDVHLARMRGLAGFDKLVVIKQIRRQLADDPEVLRMFLDEARVAARLAHPNVVQTYEVGRDGQRYFIAMEFLDGQPLSLLRGHLLERGGLPLAMHVRVLADVLAGLHHAHELTDYDGSPLGVVHRDATPQNVFITYAGAVKVIDFGIAKAKCSTVEAHARLFQGKVTYMSREQALGEPIDRRADIFAVGVMLWEAVAGRRLWAGLQPPAILQHLVAGRFPSLREASPGVPEELAAIVHKAIAPAREDRYSTAAELQGALEAYLVRRGEHPHARDLGRVLERHFTEQRTALRALVEEHVRDGQQEKTMRSPATPHAEERITVPEPAVARSRTGESSRTSRASSLSAMESPFPRVPRMRRRRSLASLGTLVLAALLVGILLTLPARFLGGGSTISAVPALVPTVPEPAPP